MDLSEFEGFDWLAPEAAFVVYERKFGHISVQIMLKDAKPDVFGPVFDTAGTELTNEQVRQTVANAVPQSANPEDLVGKVTPLHMFVRGPSVAR